MAGGIDDIPTQFDRAFLDWFRERTEAAWAEIPVLTPQEVLAQFVEWEVGGSAGQPGMHWSGGLSDDEVVAVERHWHLTFPPDYRLFLQHLHSVTPPGLRAYYLDDGVSPEAALAAGALAVALVERHGQYMVLEEGPAFTYNWLTDAEAIAGRFAWLWEGLQFDVEYANLWRPSWGPKPATLEAQKQRVRELVEVAPRLIPVSGHRYLLAEPCVAGNPVLSVYQSDIVVYGADLRDYQLVECADGLLGLSRSDVRALEKALRARIDERYSEYLAIPFWGEFL